MEAHLQRGQALLAIDYLPNWKAARGMGALLQHYRAKEMALDGFAFGGLANTLCHSLDVIPERLPLLLLRPDVWTLKKRNDETFGLAEQIP